jgi:hypothetical protein
MGKQKLRVWPESRGTALAKLASVSAQEHKVITDKEEREEKEENAKRRKEKFIKRDSRRKIEEEHELWKKEERERVSKAKMAKTTASSRRQLQFAQDKHRSSWESMPDFLLARILEDGLSCDRRDSGRMRLVCKGWKSAHDNTVKKMVISDTVEKGSPSYGSFLCEFVWNEGFQKKVFQHHAPVQYWIKDFAQFTSLEEFRMGGANKRVDESIWMSDACMKTLAERCPELTRVEVTHAEKNRLGDDGVDELVKHCTKLLRLNLSFNHGITLESEEPSDSENSENTENFTGRIHGPVYVTGLASATSLTHLNLRGNIRIGEYGLLSLMTLKSLTHLNVSRIGPGVSNEVFKQLVTRLPSLTYLDISASGVNDKGLFALHDVALVPLEHLALQYMHTVTNRGLHEAARFRTLKVLDVEGCGHVRTDLIQSFSRVWFKFNPSSTRPPTIKAHSLILLQGLIAGNMNPYGNAPVALD